MCDGSEPSIGDLLTGAFDQPHSAASTSVPITFVGRNKSVSAHGISEVGPTEGLIAYWPLNGDMLDYSGNGYHGETGDEGADPDAERTSATVVEGAAPRDRYCYTFQDSGSNGAAIDIAGVGGSNEKYILCAAGEEWSWSVWCYKTTAYSNHGIGGNWEDFSNGRLSFNSTIQMTIYTTGTDPTIDISSATWSTGVWFHLAVTHTTGNVVTVYKDGVSVGTAATNPTGDILFNRIGRNSTNSSWTSFGGYMMDFRIYNKVLTASEINILSKMFDTDATEAPQMMIGKEELNVFGEFKEQM